MSNVLPAQKFIDPGKALIGKALRQVLLHLRYLVGRKALMWIIAQANVSFQKAYSWGDEVE